MNMFWFLPVTHWESETDVASVGCPCSVPLFFPGRPCLNNRCRLIVPSDPLWSNLETEKATQRPCVLSHV